MKSFGIYILVIIISTVALSSVSCTCTQNQSDVEQNDLQLHKSLHISKCYAMHLIGKDSISEGVHILDSLWSSYHVDTTIPLFIGFAYYRAGEMDSARHWLEYTERYLDSLTHIQPSIGLYNDLLPLVYYLHGKEEAQKFIEDKDDAFRKTAEGFLSTVPSPDGFMKLVVNGWFDTYKQDDYVR